jgi:hypothetical protein
VSWDASNDNGSIITYYTITPDPGSVPSQTVTATPGVTRYSVTFNGLTAGTPYRYYITATNPIGTGQAAIVADSPPSNYTNSHYINSITTDMTAFGKADAATDIANGCGGTDVVVLAFGQIDEQPSVTTYGGYGLDEYLPQSFPFVSLTDIESQVITYETAFNAAVQAAGPQSCSVFQYTAVSFDNYHICPEASGCSATAFASEFSAMMNNLISQSNISQNDFQANEYLEYGADIETEYDQCIWNSATSLCFGSGPQASESSFPLVDAVLTGISQNDPYFAGFTNFGDDTPSSPGTAGYWSQQDEAKVMDGLNGATHTNEYSPMPMRAVPQVYNDPGSTTDFQNTINAAGPIYFYGVLTECGAGSTNTFCSSNGNDSLLPSQAFSDFQSMLNGIPSEVQLNFPLTVETNIT